MKTRVALLIFVTGVLTTAFMNCSGEGFRPQRFLSEDFSSNSGLVPNGTQPKDIEYETADMTGNIKAYQDLQFRFKIPGATAASRITATNLPSWLTVDSVNGDLAGIPPLPQTHANIMIRVENGPLPQNAGPYTITVTGDAMKTLQWHLKNTGQTAFALTPGRAGEDIHLSQSVRDRILGENVKVAVSDTGILEAHPGLAPNLLPNASRNYLRDFALLGSWLGNSSPPEANPENGHGTGVAGLIGERGWRGTGGRGVAPMVKLAGFMFIPAIDQLFANGFFTVALYDQFAGDFDVFNYSWGDGQCALIEYDQTLKDKRKLGTTNLRNGKGAIYVKAAGNDFIGPLIDCNPMVIPTAGYLGNSNNTEDGSSPYLISVAAVNANGLRSSYSSPGANVWISAPGGEIGWNATPNNRPEELQPAMVSTDFTGCDKGIKTFSAGRNLFDDGAAPNMACDHTATMNGTSSAAPVTTGTVALMLSVNPALTWRDVRHILALTADKVEPAAGNTIHPGGPANNPAGHVYQQGWVTNAAGLPFHNWYGFGRVNVDRAVNMSKTYVSQLGTFKETNTGAAYKYDSGPLNQSVPGGTVTGVTKTLTVTENWKVENVVIRVSAVNCVGALGLELTSPSGTKSIVMNINSLLLDLAIEGHEFVSNAFYNEDSAGVWTLKMINPRPNCVTTWDSWQLNVLGH